MHTSPTQVLFMQLGKDLFTSALTKVANFCFTNLLTHQLDHMGTLLGCLCRVNPRETVKKFVPTCLSILLSTPTTPKSRRGGGNHSNQNTPGGTFNSPSTPGGNLSNQNAPKSPGSPLKTPTSGGKSAGGYLHWSDGGDAYKLAPLSDMEVCLCVCVCVCVCV